MYSAFCRSYLFHKKILHMFNKFELSDLKCEKQLKTKFQLNIIMLKLFAISSVLVKYFYSMTKNIYVKNIWLQTDKFKSNNFCHVRDTNQFKLQNTAFWLITIVFYGLTQKILLLTLTLLYLPLWLDSLFNLKISVLILESYFKILMNLLLDCPCIA